MEDLLHSQTGAHRTYADKPVWWKDQQGVVHVCEGANVHPGVRLIWTLCGRDVPAGEAYTTADKSHASTCFNCRRE